MTAYSNTQKSEKERKDSADHDHTEDGLDDRARGTATDCSRSTLSCQPVTTRNQSNRKRQKRSLDEANKEVSDGDMVKSGLNVGPGRHVRDRHCRCHTAGHTKDISNPCQKRQRQDECETS